MKIRRHHNNKGYRQIKNDRPYKSLQWIIKKLKLNKKELINQQEK